MLTVRYEPLAGPVPVSIFPPEAFSEDERKKIALKAMILLARESTHGRVFPMSFEEIHAISLITIGLTPNPPTYFAVLALFDVLESVVLIDRFDDLEGLIIEAERSIKSGSNSDQVTKELYAKITGIATAFPSVPAAAGETVANTNEPRVSKLQDFLTALEEFKQVINQSNSSVSEKIRQMLILLDGKVAKLKEASREEG